MGNHQYCRWCANCVVLLPLSKHLLAQWDNTEERLGQRFTLKFGRLSIAAMSVFACNLLPAALIRFRQQYFKINITVHDVINEEVMKMVRSRYHSKHPAFLATQAY